jgi:hypothetical protein
MAVTAPKCKLCGSSHWSNEPHVWRDEPVALRPSKDAGEHAEGRKGRRALQDVPSKDRPRVRSEGKLENANPDRSQNVAGPQSSVRPIDELSPDELRARLASIRQAKTASQARWRAKQKLKP